MENEEEFFVYILILSISSQQIDIELNQVLKRVTIIDAPNIENVFVGLQRTEITVAEYGDLEVVCAVILSDQTLTQDVEVTIFTIDDTAVSCVPGPIDFISLSVDITFPSGSMSGTQQCVCVTILDDDLLEVTEHFNLSLISNSPNAITINDTAIVYITDKSPNTTFGFMQTEARVQESQGAFVDVCVMQMSPGPLIEVVTLQLMFEDETATRQDDYSPQAESITFVINSMEGATECVGVNIEDNDIVEETETFTVILETESFMEAEVDESLSNLVVTIIDDDGACIGLTSMNVVVAEEDGEVYACVQLLKPPILGNDSSYLIFTQDGTAFDGNDYIRQSRTCRFPSGSMAGDTQCLSIPIIDNSIPDGDREFTATLTTFDPLVRIEPGQSDLIILINDTDIPQLRLELSEYTVPENAGTVGVCVELVGGPLSISTFAAVLTQSQTAIAGVDYAPLNQQVIFSSGSGSGDTTCVTVNIIDDEVVETTQSFTVRLLGGNNDVAVPEDGQTATVVILDDDVTSKVTVSFKERSMVVRENSRDPAMVCVQLFPGEQPRTGRDVMNAGQDVRFEFTTKAGSANDAEDFLRSDTSFSIPSDLSQKSQTCAAVTVNDDNMFEGDEEFSVCLSDIAPANSVIVEGGESVAVTIEDDEVPAVGFQLVESTIPEAYPDKFACVEIMFTPGPLESNVEVEFYTRDGSAQAPDDYETLITTLTFQRGTDGSQARDAACVSVFIFDDDLPEETESLSFHIRSPNTSVVRIMEGFEQRTVFILDNDVLNISIDKPSYTVMENAGEGDLGLSVCATVIEATFEFTVLLIPHDGSAEETVDYRVGPGRMDFFEIPGEQRRCVCIEIVDDSNCTGNRNFSLTLYSLSDFVRAATEPVPVMIIEDDACDAAFDLRLINDSPRVSDMRVEADLFIGSNFCSVSCSVTSRDPVDCSSGSVSFDDLPNRVRPFTLFVNGILCTGTPVNLSRRFRVDNNRCSAHFINDGVTVSGDSVTVEWQGTGPSATDRINTFTCSLDEGLFDPCTPLEGFTQSGLNAGLHELIIRPEIFEGCVRRIDLRVLFTVD